MSDAKLQAAKELIEAKDYSAARGVLLTMPESTTAIKWLAQLDARYPDAPPVPVSAPLKPRGFDWPMLLVILIFIGGIGGVAFAVYQSDQTVHRNAREYVCGLTYTQYTTQWQNCVDDRR
ncbi:MAG: hypothetical protein ABI700_00750 [Chloroflexota bacterium]